MTHLTRSCVFLLFVLAASLSSIDAQADSQKLTEMSLEELMEVEIYSASRKAERTSEAPAAVTVLTREDIRRSGARTIPEVLRLVPGFHVAQLNASKWVVSARAFSGLFSNKLLVLIDGMSVYNPIYSGVYWNQHDVMLEDVERIEVIRGPGGTLWGANAVNGVVNIITRSAFDTVGTLVSVGSGTEQRLDLAARQGVKLGEEAAVRLFARYVQRDPSEREMGGEAFDEFDSFRTGTRIDVQASDISKMTLLGEFHVGNEDSEYIFSSDTPPFQQVARETANFNGGSALVKFEQTYSEDSSSVFQAYYLRTRRDEPIGTQVIDTLDFTVERRLKPTSWSELVAGLGYRRIEDDLEGQNGVLLMPESRSLDLFSAFFQGEVDLLEDELRLILGSKLEHNDYTDFEIQPNTRLVYTPNESNSLWASFSRSVRTPSRIENDLQADLTVQEVPGGSGQFTTLQTQGNRDFDSEVLNAYEMGYRTSPSENIFVDVAAFYFDYRGIYTLELGTPFPEITANGVRLTTPLRFENKSDAEAYGGEVSVTVKPLNWWSLNVGYSYVNLNIDADPDSTDFFFSGDDYDQPEHSVIVRSLIDIGEDFEFDSAFRYLAERSTAEGVEAYHELDMRLGWRASDSIDISLLGSNLLHEDHNEFREPFLSPVYTHIERAFFAKVTGKF